MTRTNTPALPSVASAYASAENTARTVLASLDAGGGDPREQSAELLRSISATVTAEAEAARLAPPVDPFAHEAKGDAAEELRAALDAFAASDPGARARALRALGRAGVLLRGLPSPSRELARLSRG